MTDVLTGFYRKPAVKPWTQLVTHFAATGVPARMTAAPSSAILESMSGRARGESEANMSFNEPPHPSAWDLPPNSWDKPPENHPWDPPPLWGKPPEHPNPWDVPPPPTWGKLPEHHHSWEVPPPPGAHKGHSPEEQADEDAIAYLYWQKTRREAGEKIDDGDLVDAVFGEDSDRSAPGRSSSGVLGIVAAVVTLLAAAAVCWSIFMGQ